MFELTADERRILAPLDEGSGELKPGGAARLGMLELRGYVRVAPGTCMGRPTGTDVAMLTEAGRIAIQATTFPAEAAEVLLEEALEHRHKAKVYAEQARGMRPPEAAKMMEAEEYHRVRANALSAALRALRVLGAPDDLHPL